MKHLPNVCITGVPGSGKSTLSKQIADKLGEKTGMQLLDLKAEAAKHGCIDGRDERRGADVIDEDALVEALEPQMNDGGYIIDWMHADMWDPAYIDFVVTLRVNNTLLFDRLTARGYEQHKITENIDTELMNVIGEENDDAFHDPDDHSFLADVQELQSDTEQDMAANVDTVVAFVQGYMIARQKINDAEKARAPAGT